MSNPNSVRHSQGLTETMILRAARTAKLCPTQKINSTSYTAYRLSSNMPSYLGQKDAQHLDADLMSDEGGFKLEQVSDFAAAFQNVNVDSTMFKLMELAGLSCAQALQDAFPDTTKWKNVLVCCGPGNQVCRVIKISSAAQPDLTITLLRVR